MLKNCHEANSISRITQIPRKDKQQKKGDVMTSKKFLPGERMNRPFSPGLWILIASLIIVLSPLNVIAKAIHLWGSISLWRTPRTVRRKTLPTPCLKQ